jgi:hypothetical protein
MLEEALDQQKNWQELMQRVYQDKITGEQAYEIGYPWVQKEDALVADVYLDKVDLILKLSRDIIEATEDVVEKNYYKYCHRGFFGASLIDVEKGIVINGDELKNYNLMRLSVNRPPWALLEICRFDGVCSRSITNKSHGLSYDTCPSRHSREALHPGGYSTTNMIWVEGGAVWKDGKFIHWNIDNHKYKIYPCIICLSRSLMQEIDVLARLSYNDEWSVSFHDVAAHAALLLIVTTADQLAR